MIKANLTIFHFYLSLMDYLSESLSQKYSESSLNDSKHFETVIIAKINRMFHSLEILSKNSNDEISARCLLRSILDSVATYCFIYNKQDREEKMFRHYLYVLDGYRVYKDYVVNGIAEDKDKYCFEVTLNIAIKQIEEKINHHSYSQKASQIVKKIIKEANWKYESLSNGGKYNFVTLYEMMGVEDKTSYYYQQYLSQFSHGLCLSNIPLSEGKTMNRVLYESIIIADRMIKSIYYSFRDYDALSSFLTSTSAQEFLNSPEFQIDELAEFVRSIMANDDKILI